MPASPDGWIEHVVDQYKVYLDELFAHKLSDDLLHAFTRDIAADFAAASVAWQRNPAGLAELQRDWMRGLNGIGVNAVKGSDQLGATRDLHQLLTRVIERFVDEMPGDDRCLRDRLRVARRIWLAALTPENFLLGNPQALTQAKRSAGESLIKGLANLRSDLKSSKAGLRVASAAKDDYQLGESLATTAGEIVFQNELFQLIQYYPTSGEVEAVPVLFLPPWINKYYVLDLTPGTSLVKWLVGEGYTVFMVSWVNPDASSANLSMDDYLTLGALPALEVAGEICDCDSVSLVGYCIGGVLAACLTAWLAAEPASAQAASRRVHCLTLINTLLDYSNPGEVGLYIAPNMLAALERQMQRDGVLDGRILSVAFGLLRAEKHYWPQFVKRYLLGEAAGRDPLAYWNFDATNLPRQMAWDYLTRFYRENCLMAKTPPHFAGRDLDFERVTTPCIAVACEYDHIVPWRSALSGLRHFGGGARVLRVSGGHVAGVLSSPLAGSNEAAAYRVADIGPENDAPVWGAAAEGSWWPEWLAWLRTYDRGLCAARFPGGEGYAPLEPAPGSYVAVRLDD